MSSQIVHKGQIAVEANLLADENKVRVFINSKMVVQGVPVDTRLNTEENLVDTTFDAFLKLEDMPGNNHCMFYAMVSNEKLVGVIYEKGTLS